MKKWAQEEGISWILFPEFFSHWRVKSFYREAGVPNANYPLLEEVG